jgi:hypothetical protein
MRLRVRALAPGVGSAADGTAATHSGTPMDAFAILPAKRADATPERPASRDLRVTVTGSASRSSLCHSEWQPATALDHWPRQAADRRLGRP